MIAPLRSSQRTERTRREPEELYRARRLVAETFLAAPDPEPAAVPVPTWQAWLLVGWMCISATVYLVMMGGTWIRK